MLCFDFGDTAEQKVEEMDRQNFTKIYNKTDDIERNHTIDNLHDTMKNLLRLIGYPF